jgi:hypothetical protein
MDLVEARLEVLLAEEWRACVEHLDQLHNRGKVRELIS